MSFTIEQQGTTIAMVMKDIVYGLDGALAGIALKGAIFAAGVMQGEIRAKLSKRPTGRMAGTVTAFLVESGGKIAGAACAPDTVYARVQNEGATIIAKTKKLAVPLPGVPIGKGPRDWPDGALRVIPGRSLPGGESILAQVTERGVKAKYVLKDEVKIPGVHYVESTLELAATDIEEIASDAFDASLDMAAKK